MADMEDSYRFTAEGAEDAERKKGEKEEERSIKRGIT
jgi:hypothetical protein